MGLVEDDQVAVQVFPAVHGVVELIPENLGGSDDDRGVGVFLRVSGHDADIGLIEVLPEFDPFGIGQGLQGGGVPAASPVLEDGADRLFGDPGFSGAGGGHDQTVAKPDRFEGVRLKRVRPERLGDGFPDLREDRLQRRFGLRFHPDVGPCMSVAVRLFRRLLSARPACFSNGSFPGGCFMNHDALYHRWPAS
jgi:hypothetical protein